MKDEKEIIVSLVRADGIQVEIQLRCVVEKDPAKNVTHAAVLEKYCKKMTPVMNQVATSMRAAGFNMTPKEYRYAKRNVPRSDVSYRVQLSSMFDRIRYEVQLKRAGHSSSVLANQEVTDVAGIPENLERLHRELQEYFPLLLK